MSLKGIVQGYEIGKNKDGDQNVLLLQVTMSDPDDTQTIEYKSGFGCMGIPNKGAEVDIIMINESYKVAIASNDGLDFNSSLNAGEKVIYSLDSANIKKAFITWLDTGLLHLNGNNDYATRYNAFNTALQSLITKVNAETTKIAAALPAYLATRSTIAQDFSGAKVDEVKIV